MDEQQPKKGVGEIDDYIKGNLNQGDLYKKVLSNYEKDLEKKLEEEEEEEEVPSKNTFSEFMKYFFFIK